jgi:hypothetical protein
VRTDTTSPGAARPEPGTLWVWEPHSLTAVALIEVVRTVWNGEEWQVLARVVAAKTAEFGGQKVGGEYWNDLDRFWKACYRVAHQPGLVGSPRGIRRGPLQAGEHDVDLPAR